MFDGYRNEYCISNFKHNFAKDIDEYTYTEKFINTIDDLLNNEAIDKKLIKDENIINQASYELRGVLLFYMIDNYIYEEIIGQENDNSLNNLITEDVYDKIVTTFKSIFSKDEEVDINVGHNCIIDALTACENIKRTSDIIDKYKISDDDISYVNYILYKYIEPTTIEDLDYMTRKFLIPEEFIKEENYKPNILESDVDYCAFIDTIIKERILIYRLINYIEYNIRNLNDYEYDIYEILNIICLYKNRDRLIPKMCIELIKHTIMDNYPEVDLENIEQVSNYMVNFIITEGFDYSFRLCDILYEVIQLAKKYKLFNYELNKYYNLVYVGKMLLNIYNYINYGEIIKFDIIDDNQYNITDYFKAIQNSVLHHLYFFDEEHMVEYHDDSD